jgi:hypothetical protein
MPNWCENTLVVVETNNGMTLEEILAPYLTSDSSEIDFNLIVPVEERKSNPQDSVILFPKEFYVWGTKSRYAEIMVVGKNCVMFNTAWTPPIKAIAALANIYRETKFALHYSEMGVGFKGHTIIVYDPTKDTILIKDQWQEFSEPIVQTYRITENGEEEEVSEG